MKKKSLDQWAWEFLRRNSKYVKDWERLTQGWSGKKNRKLVAFPDTNGGFYITWTPKGIIKILARRVLCPRCKAVKRETLSWLAKSARFTQQFEDRIGQLCREMTISRVAELNNLTWDQVWRMEKSYMRRLLEQNPPSEELRAIGIDEISTRKGHTYSVVVTDLDRMRPI